MSRMRFRGPLRAFKDAAETKAIYDPVGTDGTDERVHQDYTKLQHGEFDIAAGQTVNIPLGDITSPIRGLEVRATGDVRIALNGGTAMICNRDVEATDVEEDVLLFIRAALTSVAITVDPALVGSITGRWCIWGDVAA